MPTEKCNRCGKPFPTGLSQCNWCDGVPAGVVMNPIEHNVGDQEAEARATGESGLLTVIGTLFLWLSRGMVIVLGLLLVLGGGLFGLCGSMAGNGGWLLILIGIVPIALGWHFIKLASGGGRRPEPREDEGGADETSGLR